MSQQLKDLLIGLAIIVGECIVGVGIAHVISRAWL